MSTSARPTHPGSAPAGTGAGRSPAASSARAPVLLAFDTSTEQMAVALVCGGEWRTLNEPGGAAASATLLPRARALLVQAGLNWQSLDAIAFGQGPGAFTGLRTACAVAQGLALGLGLGLLPIDSLLIVAEDARGQPGAGLDDTGGFSVDVAMDARMDEAYAGRYRHSGGEWQTLTAPALLSLPALAASAASHAAAGHWAGSAWALHAERLPPSPGRVLSEVDRAGALGRLAAAAWHAGQAVDPAGALPLYLRDKVALTTDERLAAKQRAAAGAPAA